MDWKRVSRWPARDAQVWLGVPADMVAHVHAVYEMGFVLERLTRGARFASSEVRIPCKHGELTPVGRDLWSWTGPGGYWTRQIRAAAGLGVTGPFGTGLCDGTRDDESQAWFSSALFEKVAKAAGARRRSRTWKVTSAGPPLKFPKKSARQHA